MTLYGVDHLDSGANGLSPALVKTSQDHMETVHFYSGSNGLSALGDDFTYKGPH